MDTYSIKSPYVFLFFKVLFKYLLDTYTCTVEEIKDSTIPSLLTAVWEGLQGQVVDPTTYVLLVVFNVYKNSSDIS